MFLRTVLSVHPSTHMREIRVLGNLWIEKCTKFSALGCHNRWHCSKIWIVYCARLLKQQLLLNQCRYPTLYFNLAGWSKKVQLWENFYSEWQIHYMAPKVYDGYREIRIFSARSVQNVVRTYLTARIARDINSVLHFYTSTIIIISFPLKNREPIFEKLFCGYFLVAFIEKRYFEE